MLQKTRFHGIPLTLVRRVAFQARVLPRRCPPCLAGERTALSGGAPPVRGGAAQVLSALSFISSPEVNIIHCDVKPENILLRDPKSSDVKLIDFGSSCFKGKRVYQYIQSRFYRSPEVILGLPYAAHIDVWSLGCVLVSARAPPPPPAARLSSLRKRRAPAAQVEMHTGKPLFGGSDEGDQLRKICEVTGIPDAAVVEQGSKWRRFLRRRGAQYELVPPIDRRQRVGPPGSRSLEDVLGARAGGPRGQWRGRQGHSRGDYNLYVRVRARRRRRRRASGQQRWV
jgi:dual specificity tyrosine-phosphorylation-regulated kinase 1